MQRPGWQNEPDLRGMIQEEEDLARRALHVKENTAWLDRVIAIGTLIGVWAIAVIALFIVGLIFWYLPPIIEIGREIADGGKMVSDGYLTLKQIADDNNVDLVEVARAVLPQDTDEAIDWGLLVRDSGLGILNMAKQANDLMVVDYSAAVIEHTSTLLSSDAAPHVEEAGGILVRYVAEQASNGNIATAAGLLRTSVLVGLNVTDNPRFYEMFNGLEGSITTLLRDEKVREILTNMRDASDGGKKIVQRIGDMIIGPRSDYVKERTYQLYRRLTDGEHIDMVSERFDVIWDSVARVAQQAADQNMMEQATRAIDTLNRTLSLAERVHNDIHKGVAISFPE